MDLKLLKLLEKDLSPLGLRVLGDLYEDDGNSVASRNYHIIANYIEQIESPMEMLQVAKMGKSPAGNVTLKRCPKCTVLQIGESLPRHYQSRNLVLVALWNELKKSGYPFTDELSSVVKGHPNWAGRTFLLHHGGMRVNHALIRVPFASIDRKEVGCIRRNFSKKSKTSQYFRKLVLSLKIGGII